MALNAEGNPISTSPRRSSHTRAQTQAPTSSRSRHLSPTPSTKPKQSRTPWRSPSSSSLSVSLSPFRPGLSPPSTTNVQVTKAIAQPELSGEGQLGAAEVAAKAAAASASASLLDIAEGSSRSSIASRSRSGSRGQSGNGNGNGTIGRAGMRRASRSVLGEEGLQSLDGRLKTLDESVTVSSPEEMTPQHPISSPQPLSSESVPTLTLTTSDSASLQHPSTSSPTSLVQSGKDITSPDAAPSTSTAESTAPPAALDSSTSPQPSLSSLPALPPSTPSSPPPSTSSGSTSWFASFSRKKGKRAVSSLSTSSAATSKSAPLLQAPSNTSLEVPPVAAFAASTDALVGGKMDPEEFNATPNPVEPSTISVPGRHGGGIEDEFPAVVAITDAFPAPAPIASPVEGEHAIEGLPRSGLATSSLPTADTLLEQAIASTTPPAPSAPIATSPKKRSWFYSSSKSSSSQTSLATKPSPLSQLSVVAPPPPPPAVAEAVLDAISPPPSTASIPSPASTLVGPDSTIKALAPTKLKAKAKPDLQLVFSTANVPAGPTSIASSIDDKVPSLPSTPTPGHTAKVIISPPVSGNLFTLSLPLLGRAKIPLGVTAAPSNDSTRSKDGGTLDSSSIEAGTRERSRTEAQTTSQDATTMTITTDPPFANISSDGSEPLLPQDSTSNQTGSADSVTQAASTSTISSSVSVDSNTSTDASTSKEPLSSSKATDEATIQQKAAPGGEAATATSWWTYVGWGAGSTSPGPANGNAPDTENVSSTSSVPAISQPGLSDISTTADTIHSNTAQSRSQDSTTSTDTANGDHERQSPSRPTVNAPTLVDSRPDVGGPDDNRKETETGTSQPQVNQAGLVESLEADGRGGSEEQIGSRGQEDNMEKVDEGKGDGGGGVTAWLSPWSWYPTPAQSTSTEKASETAVTAADSGSTCPTAAAAASSASTSDDLPTTPGGRSRQHEEVEEDGTRNAKNSGQAGASPRENSCSNGKVEESSKTSTEALDATVTTENEVVMNEVQSGLVPTSTTSNPANPIEATIQSNRSGWASFFSSRALVVKTIGPGDTDKKDGVKRDQNGVEVMDIESDDEQEASPAKDDLEVVEPSPLITATQAIAKVIPLSPAPSQSSQTSGKYTREPPSDGKPATPLTQDDKIKEKVKDSVPSKPSKNGASVPPSPTSSPSISKSPSKDKNQTASAPTTPKRTQSPAPSKKSIPPSPPNLVLPTWEDIFDTSPRSIPPPAPSPSTANPSPPMSAPSISNPQDTKTILGKTMKFVSGVLFAKDSAQSQDPQIHPSSSSQPQRAAGSRPRMSRLGSAINVEGTATSLDIQTLLQQEREKRLERFGEKLPKAWNIVDPPPVTPATPSIKRTLSFEGLLHGGASARQVDDVLRGCKRVVIIGVHGWFPGAVMRTVLGEPTGTSSKFANMMEQALHDFEDAHGVQLEKVTKIPLEGEGTISRRVEKLYGSLLINNEWMKDIHEADAIIVATHSQGSVVSTHLLDRLISDKHIRTHVEQVELSGGETFPSSVGVSFSPTRKPQRICCLALCGIHLGPLRYLSSSSLLQPYFQYFESAAARELFEFQSTESAVSKSYVSALRNVVHHGVKMVYVASLNDQVVPIYSGIFSAVSHPLILRALYIDGDAYHSSDFLSNLLVLLLRIRNAGIPDGGLLAHLSEATAGSLSGIGHSTAYEEPATFALAVRYLFEANEGTSPYPELEMDSFDAAHEQNDYEIPWSLRDVIADERVIQFFSKEIAQLRDAFHDWHPKTTILRDLKRKLQPIQRLPSSFSSLHSTSKL